MYGETDGGVPPEARDEQPYTPKEITSEKDLVQFWLTYDKNNNEALVDPKQELQRAEELTKNSLEKQKKPDDLRHFWGITDGDQMIATGMARILVVNGIKFGYSGLLTVNQEKTEAQKQENKKRKLHDRITDAGEAWAKTEGCDYFSASVNCDNPLGLQIKLNRDYQLNELITSQPDEEDKVHQWFNVVKRANGPKEHMTESQDVQLSDLVTIQKLLGEGWVGTKIVSTDTKKTSKKPENWMLTMQKPESSDSPLPKIGG